jgi:hypothetical protein
MWVGDGSTMPNPVSYFFYGPHGIFAANPAYSAIKERMGNFDSTKLPISVLLQEKYNGAAFIVVYKPKVTIMEQENPPVQ